jgi:hypothetical protein
MMIKIERNEKCPCDSGKKYKKCCYQDPEKNAEILRAAARSATREEMAAMLSSPLKVYRLKVKLLRMGMQEIGKEISRTMELTGRQTLYDLHLAIQDAFDWDNDHMFSFFISGTLFDRETEYSGDPLGGHIVTGLGVPTHPASKTELRDLDLSEDARFLYLFDYGDELVHEVLVAAMRDRNDNDRDLPMVVDEIGTPPDQYGDDEFYNGAAQ